MMHHIVTVEPQEDFLLLLTFQGGEERVFDLKPYLRGDLFTPLKDEALFKQVRPSKKPRGVVWPNGADLCADMLYLNSRPQVTDMSHAVSHDPPQEVEIDLLARWHPPKPLLSWSGLRKRLGNCLVSMKTKCPKGGQVLDRTSEAIITDQ